MSILVRDLLKLELFQNIITLVSEEKGMDTMVTWPYIKQTVELKQWINGGEIVFVMGSNEDKTKEEQIKLLKEGRENSVSAFVFLCGNEYIHKLDNEVIQYANKIEMPVFTMPYNVKLIDVIREIANTIMESGNREKLVFNFMTDLLNKNYSSEDHIKKRGYECGIILDQCCMSMAVSTDFDYENESYNKIMNYRNTMEYVLKRIEQIGSKFEMQVITVFHMSKSICLFFMENEDKKLEMCREINEFLDYFFKYNELAVFTGYSTVHKGVKGCLSAVEESKKAAVFAKKSEGKRISYNYSEMGFLRLLVSSNSKEELMKYCREVLGVLIDSDRENNTEHMMTVKVYLENNNNLVSSANQLFIHRNTLINRINHIEEITGKSLKNADVKLEYLCAFRLLEFLSD